MTKKLINHKLSIENFLVISNDFEILKRKIFNEEEYKEYEELPNLTLKEQMNLNFKLI